MEAWELRDFDDNSVLRPGIQPDEIERITAETEFAPILWIEELDKFSPTERRLGYLFRLIDAVYERQGTIITTTNEKLPALKKRIGAPLYRRLSGENDDPALFLVWDFWSLIPKS